MSDLTLFGMASALVPPCGDCGETLPHACFEVVGYSCVRCGSAARLVRYVHDGEPTPADYYFSCGGHHGGTMIAARILSDDGVKLVSLDARPRHHSDGPATERTAANLAWPKAGSNRRRILDALHRASPGGFTADELSALLGMHSARQRLNDLKAGGWVEGTGGTRPTRQGAPAEVYVLTAEALEAQLRALDVEPVMQTARPW